MKKRLFVFFAVFLMMFAFTQTGPAAMAATEYYTTTSSNGRTIYVRKTGNHYDLTYYNTNGYSNVSFDIINGRITNFTEGTGYSYNPAYPYYPSQTPKKSRTKVSGSVNIDFSKIYNANNSAVNSFNDDNFTGNTLNSIKITDDSVKSNGTHNITIKYTVKTGGPVNTVNTGYSLNKTVQLVDTNGTTDENDDVVIDAAKITSKNIVPGATSVTGTMTFYNIYPGSYYLKYENKAYQDSAWYQVVKLNIPNIFIDVSSLYQNPNVSVMYDGRSNDIAIDTSRVPLVFDDYTNKHKSMTLNSLAISCIPANSSKYTVSANYSITVSSNDTTFKENHSLEVPVYLVNEQGSVAYSTVIKHENVNAGQTLKGTVNFTGVAPGRYTFIIKRWTGSTTVSEDGSPIIIKYPDLPYTVHSITSDSEINITELKLTKWEDYRIISRNYNIDVSYSLKWKKASQVGSRGFFQTVYLVNTDGTRISSATMSVGNGVTKGSLHFENIPAGTYRLEFIDIPEISTTPVIPNISWTYTVPTYIFSDSSYAWGVVRKISITDQDILYGSYSFKVKLEVEPVNIDRDKKYSSDDFTKELRLYDSQGNLVGTGHMNQSSITPGTRFTCYIPFYGIPALDTEYKLNFSDSDIVFGDGTDTITDVHVPDRYENTTLDSSSSHYKDPEATATK